MEKSRFRKTERLRSKKRIELLFREGKSIRKSCVKCLYLVSDESLSSPVQVMISVPKKLFKRAVDRNLIKRRVREAYRLNKDALFHFSIAKNTHFILAFLFVHSEVMDYHSIEQAIQQIISELIHEFQ